MSKNYAVFHSEKGKVSSAVIGRHFDRTKGAEYTYEHADPSRKNLNIHFDLGDFTTMELHEAVEKRIEEGYQAKNKAGELKAIRKDAVKYNTHILTGTHEKMKEIEDNPQQREAWIVANLDFIKKEFGSENLVRFAVHRDEKTMHIHAVTVNLTKDGRLSAKEIIGSKKEMQQRQDRYSEAMKPFGLERGLRNTGISHEGSREYYARMEESLKEGDSSEDLKVNKTFLGFQKGLDVENTIKNYENALKREKTAKKSLQIEISSLQKKFEENNNLKNHYFEKLKHSESNRTAEIAELQNQIKELKNENKNHLFSIETILWKADLSRKREVFIEHTNSVMINRALELGRPIETKDYDEIVRDEMQKLNPSMNPWSIQAHFFKDENGNDLFWEVCQEINENFKKLELEKQTKPKKDIAEEVKNTKKKGRRI